MRNGTSLDTAQQRADQPDAQTVKLDEATVSRSSSKPTAVENVPDHHHQTDFGSTSFSFAVERTTEPEIKPSSRMTTFPKLDAERTREGLANRTNSRTEKAAPASARNSVIAKAKVRGGMRTLLDKYISFLAGILKAIERFLLRRFVRSNEAAPQQTTSQSNEAGEATTAEKPAAKNRNQKPVRGPGI